MRPQHHSRLSPSRVLRASSLQLQRVFEAMLPGGYGMEAAKNLALQAECFQLECFQAECFHPNDSVKEQVEELLYKYSRQLGPRMPARAPAAGGNVNVSISVSNAVSDDGEPLSNATPELRTLDFMTSREKLQAAEQARQAGQFVTVNFGSVAGVIRSDVDDDQQTAAYVFPKPRAKPALRIFIVCAPGLQGGAAGSPRPTVEEVPVHHYSRATSAAQGSAVFAVEESVGSEARSTATGLDVRQGSAVAMETAVVGVLDTESPAAVVSDIQQAAVVVETVAGQTDSLDFIVPPSGVYGAAAQQAAASEMTPGASSEFGCSVPEPMSKPAVSGCSLELQGWDAIGWGMGLYLSPPREEVPLQLKRSAWAEAETGEQECVGAEGSEARSAAAGLDVPLWRSNPVGADDGIGAGSIAAAAGEIFRLPSSRGSSPEPQMWETASLWHQWQQQEPPHQWQWSAEEAQQGAAVAAEHEESWRGEGAEARSGWCSSLRSSNALFSSSDGNAVVESAAVSGDARLIQTLLSQLEALEKERLLQQEQSACQIRALQQQVADLSEKVQASAAEAATAKSEVAGLHVGLREVLRRLSVAEETVREIQVDKRKSERSAIARRPSTAAFETDLLSEPDQRCKEVAEAVVWTPEAVPVCSADSSRRGTATGVSGRPPSESKRRLGSKGSSQVKSGGRSSEVRARGKTGSPSPACSEVARTPVALLPIECSAALFVEVLRAVKRALGSSSSVKKAEGLVRSSSELQGRGKTGPPPPTCVEVCAGETQLSRLRPSYDNTAALRSTTITEVRSISGGGGPCWGLSISSGGGSSQRPCASSIMPSSEPEDTTKSRPDFAQRIFEPPVFGSYSIAEYSLSSGNYVLESERFVRDCASKEYTFVGDCSWKSREPGSCVC